MEIDKIFYICTTDVALLLFKRQEKKYLMRSILIVCIVLLGVSCQGNLGGDSEKSIQEIQADGGVSSIIRSPVTANEPVDSINVAKMDFQIENYDFGEVLEGDIVTHKFDFVNTGKVPLIINGARSTCGCTVPEWPKEPVPPGESGTISVKFDTKNKKNNQTKAVTITANTYPAQTKVFLKGFVIPKDNN